MKFSALIFVLLFPVSTFASSISDELARKDVSHLDLIANNLNMFYLSKMDAKNGNKNASEVEESFVRFSVTKKKQIMMQSFYIAPVSKVTSEQCKALLDGIVSKTKDKDSSIHKVFPILTVLEFTPKHTAQLLSEMKFSVYLQAKENNQLSLNCE
jgi:hypothetical protein